MRRHRAHFWAAMAGVLTTWATSPALAGYVFTNFDGAGNHAGGTTIDAINNNGAVVGFSTAANGAFTNFIRNPNGTFTVLSSLGPADVANGLNDNNVVVGTSNGNAFALSNGILTFLPQVKPGVTANEVAFGINDNGTIVGQYGDTQSLTVPGFVYAGGKFTILTPVANQLVTNAQAINNNGLGIGFYTTTDTPVIDGNTPQHGFLFNTNTNTTTLIADPNQPNFFTVQLLGINDNNIAAGYWQDTAGNQHGLLYDVATQTYTFLDDPNAAVVNGMEITQITGINNAGELTGFYIGSDGLSHGFVATPTTPEPSSLALLGMGASVFLGCLLRRSSLRTG